MNARTDFNAIAAGAAAVNAEDAYDRARRLIATTESSTLDGRSAFASRIAFMTYADKRQERDARQAVFDAIASERNHADMLEDCQEQAANERATMDKWSDHNDRDGIDHHAAKNTHDGAGLRIL